MGRRCHRHGEDSRSGWGGIGARCGRHGEDSRSGWSGIGARRGLHGGDSRSGWGGIGARCDHHGEDSRGGWGGIGEFVSAREKIRRYGNRPHRLDTPLPCPIVIGWRGPWLSPGPTHHEVNHGQQVSSACSAARPQPQQGLVSGMLDQLQDEMRDEIAELPTRRGASRDAHIPRDVHASPGDPGPTHCERCDQDGRSSRRKPSAASGLHVLCSGQRGAVLEHKAVHKRDVVGDHRFACW